MKVLLGAGLGLALLTIQADAQWVPKPGTTWGDSADRAAKRAGGPPRRRNVEDPVYRATMNRLPDRRPKAVDPWEKMREPTK
jgi:hypothetical protein